MKLNYSEVTETLVVTINNKTHTIKNMSPMMFEGLQNIKALRHHINKLIAREELKNKYLQQA